MNKERNVFNVQLDDEEKDLLASLERGEWKTVDNLKRKLPRLRQ